MALLVIGRAASRRCSVQGAWTWRPRERVLPLGTPEQGGLVERASRGEFRTYDEARRWVEEQRGVKYRYKGIYALLARMGVRPKVPRPAAGKADPRSQEA